VAKFAGPERATPLAADGVVETGQLSGMVLALEDGHEQQINLSLLRRGGDTSEFRGRDRRLQHQGSWGLAC
jgi:hypothetical protein